MKSIQTGPPAFPGRGRAACPRRPRPRLAGALALALALAALTAGPARAAGTANGSGLTPARRLQVQQALAHPDYPHPAVYLYLSSDGRQLDSDSMVAKIARFSLAVIHASPATELYASRLAQIRALNPKIILVAYFPGDFMWPGDGYPVGNIFGDAWRAYQSNDWWLYATDGTPFKFWGNTVDLTRPEVTTWMADYIYQRVVQPGIWDGLFLDDFCESNYWKQDFNGQFIDENRDGVPDVQAVFDPVWKAGTDSLASKLRARVGPDFPLIGNCGYGSKWTTMNGWMREDFPHQGDWTSNMFSGSGGYLVNESQYRSPQVNFVYGTSLKPPADVSPGNLQFMRFCLGSCLLSNGYFMFDTRDVTLLPSDEYFDEYDGGGRGVGYLGQPLGPYYQQIGLLNTPEQLTNTGFESGLTGWTTYNLVGTTLLDPSTKVEGGYSAHVVVPSATDYPSQVHLRQRLTLPNRNYALTFWAKAAVPRTIWVMAQRIDGPITIFTYTPVTLDTTWRQYQVLSSITTACTFDLSILAGQQVGDVWLDDLHYQQGASSVYRRDFDRGTVMVNPSSTAVNVQLGHPFQKLLGHQDPVTNDGSLVSAVSIAPSDAIILLNPSTDVTPPTAVSDLHMTGQPH